MSNPVHTSATMMCGDLANKPSTAWKAVHSEKVMCKSQSGTAFQAVRNNYYFLSEGILSFVEYAPRLLMVLPSWQFLTC